MLVQREAAIGYRMMRKEAGGLAEPCGSAPATSDSGGGTGFILPVRKKTKNRRSVRNAFIGFLGNFSDSSFSFQIKI
jgi:hypothetical protein